MTSTGEVMEAMMLGQERKAFEDWLTDCDTNPQAPPRDNRGNYLESDVRDMWRVWQARAHLAQPAQAVDVGAIREAAVALLALCDDKLRGERASEARNIWWKLNRALSGEKAGPVGDGWQPIETAPKDGTSVLLAFGGKRPTGGRWDDDRYAKVPRPYWSTDNERIVGIPWLRSNPPIAWMPLPASPTPDKEGER